MTFHTSSPEETIALGERIGRLLLPGDVVAPSRNARRRLNDHNLGIARGLGVDEDVTSPTFTLVSEYPAACGSTTWTSIASTPSTTS
jgi:tRNA threonylcarbamoyladenosine biosynthesis protein TsaE